VLAKPARLQIGRQRATSMPQVHGKLTFFQTCENEVLPNLNRSQSICFGSLPDRGGQGTILRKIFELLGLCLL
jgi:hypothetical protein